MTGHTAELHCIRFSKDGNLLVSGGLDKQIFVWDVYNECNNVGVMKGHKGCILSLSYASENDKVVSGSSDKTIQVYDMEQFKRMRKYIGHSEQVNSVDTTNSLIVSASDDQCLKIWDYR